MVITDEFKFPRPLDWAKFSDPRKVREVYGISSVLPIKQIQRRWYRTHETGEHGSAEEGQLATALQELIDQFNDDLQAHGVDMHINLLRTKDGYALEVYDCSALDLCRIIKKETVDLADLPALLKNLQEGAGLLVDRES